MTIRQLIRQGFHYARTCKSLWLFGFFVGIASGGSSSGSGGGGVGVGIGPVGVSAGPGGFSMAQIGFVLVLLCAAATVTLIVHSLSEGALIEGVVRARDGAPMTTSEGFRAGWAHWGVLLRITVIYFAAVLATLLVAVLPCVIAFRAAGAIVGLAVAIPALLVAVPWLITLYVVQAFAARIAVLENRHAVDALRKARLFLHGRLELALKMIVATFLGTLLITIVGVVGIAPVVLLLVLLARMASVLPAIILGCLVLLPMFYVLTAILGTFRSSVWTIGYVTRENA
jgi:hypothetical protein